jgi:protein-L-isoaspartate O-methyltransferase
VSSPQWAKPAPPEWVRALLSAGGLRPDWAPIFADVPRRLFLPDLMWPYDPQTGGYRTVNKAHDPPTWERWADADTALVTQWDDGNHVGSKPGAVATSSASAPTLVAQMLDDLDIQPRHRVLDVGVGTGWTTALLSARLGDDRVTGIEFDPQVASEATRRLAAAGYHPTVITGDGTTGYAAGAPYDRIQATYAVRRIPPAWTEQTRSGGLIVAPWVTPFTHTGAIARLTVTAPGHASGRFTRPAEFMHSRPERVTWPHHADYVPSGDWPDDTTESTTTVRHSDLWDSPSGITEFVVGARVPDVVATVNQGPEGGMVAWFYSLTCRSWAVTFFDDDEPSEVYQGGDRRVWDEIESAYSWWDGHGRPGYGDLRLTVSPAGQRVEL